MTNLFSQNNLIKFLLSLLMMAFSTCIVAAEKGYSSELINKSKHAGSEGFVLVEDQQWPSPECIIESSKKMINPGESSKLKIKKDKKCQASGISYGIYDAADKKLANRIANLAHDFNGEKLGFTLQVAMFCGEKCAFKGLQQQILVEALPASHSATTKETYRSELINQGQRDGSKGYKLIKTKLWPAASTRCIIDSGKKILFPGESTYLIIKKDKKCAESGVGYSIYKIEDTKNEHLLGYTSHRHEKGKFFLQVGRFCVDHQCVFKDLNPEQKRKN